MGLVAATIGFWIFAILVVARLIRLGTSEWPPARRGLAAWALVLIAAALLLFRPHEDIFGGQDGGAYLNYGARFARQPHLLYQDSLLAQVPLETREDFLYYDFGRPYQSKDGLGQVKDFHRALMGPWFQPAAAIVLSAAARTGSPGWVLYVIPLFALFTALALRALACQILPHRWAGALAFFFFLSNPLVIWQARQPRPEVMAAFLLFGGMALLIHASRAPAFRRWPDLLLGSLCLGLAPFFHITAAMVVVPAAFLLAVMILAGRPDFLIAPITLAGALLLIMIQAYWVTDIYHLQSILDPLRRHYQLAGGLAGAGFLLLAAISSIMRRRQNRQGAAGDALGRLYHPVIAVLAGLTVLGAYGACYRLALHTPPQPSLTEYYYFYRTDLRAALNMISWPIGIAGLIGLIILAIRGGPARLALLLVTIPATLVIGNFYDFFGTRYLLVTFLPLLALGLTAVVTLIPDRAAPQRIAILGLAILLALIGLPHRTHLVRLTEYRGLTRYLAAYADIIRKQNGLLLFEYSRLAAPFDHLFGIPTLGLKNEWLNNYARAEEAWAQILRNHSGQSAFFITPFQPPVSDRFVFTPVAMTEPSYNSRRLIQNRWELPTQIADWGLELKLYRMALRSPTPEPQALKPEPLFCYAFDAGNMGIRGFTRGRDKTWEVEGVALKPGQAFSLPVPNGIATNDVQEWLCIFLRPDAVSPLTLYAVSDSGTVTNQPRQLVQDWWLARLPANLLMPTRQLALSASQPVLLADVIGVTPTRTISLLQAVDAGKKTTVPVARFPSRGITGEAQVCLSAPYNGRGYLLFFQIAPEEAGPAAALRWLTPQNTNGVTLTVPTGKWLWSVWPLGPLNSLSGPHWFTVRYEALTPPEKSESKSVQPLTPPSAGQATHLSRSERDGSRLTGLEALAGYLVVLPQ